MADDTIPGLIWEDHIVEPSFPIEVVDGRKAGVWFDHDTYPGCRDRELKLRWLVFHHQGGEGGPKALHRVLRTRKSKRTGNPFFLGIHFQITQDGSIVQMADLKSVVQHAGPKANGISIGVEIANRGWGKPDPRWPREDYVDWVHGRKVGNFLRFYDDQVNAAFDLACAVTEITGIPYRIPMSKGSVRRDVMPREQERRFRGIIGHYHISSRKVDPVPHLLDELAERMITFEEDEA